MSSAAVTAQQSHGQSETETTVTPKRPRWKSFTQRTDTLKSLVRTGNWSNSSYLLLLIILHISDETLVSVFLHYFKFMLMYLSCVSSTSLLISLLHTEVSRLHSEACVQQLLHDFLIFNQTHTSEYLSV